ncbi:MAG: glycosyltransferase family 2 protein [Candidatus Krumholzibacteria bacterium]|nr:glycosyltransferase family 2 protein [Candidatus Krumholzibacteria bacterium]
MAPDLSTVIVAYNSPRLLTGALRSLDRAIRSDTGRTHEIIVVDNASRHPIADPPDLSVRLIRNRRNLGFAGGANVGYEASRGRYLLFANPDIEVYPDTLGRLIELTDADRAVAACTPFLELMVSRQLDLGAHRGLPTPWAALTHFLGLARLCRGSRGLSRLFGRYQLLDRDLARPHEVDVIEGGFCFIRRDAFEAVGGWDEDYFLFGEDIELCYRLRARGQRVMYFPQVRARSRIGTLLGARAALPCEPGRGFF